MRRYRGLKNQYLLFSRSKATSLREEEIILILNRVCNKEYNVDEKKKWLVK